MQSKFGFGAYFVALLSFVFSVMAIGIALLPFLVADFPIAFLFVLAPFVVFVWLWLVWGELRTKAVSLYIDFDNLATQGFLGLGKSKTIYFNEIDGFMISLLPNNAGYVEYLYIIINNKKVIKLSQFYHRNYAGLKSYIVDSKIKYLGEEPFSYRKELTEIFK